MLNGEYGCSDVCLGVPIKIDKGNMMKIQEIDLAKSEQESLKRSGEVVKQYILNEAYQLN